MAVAKEKAPEVKASSYQTQLNEVDQMIESLQAKKHELAKLALKEIGEVVEMPLHQLNAIGAIGYEAAKKKAGDNWIE